MALKTLKTIDFGIKCLIDSVATQWQLLLRSQAQPSEVAAGTLRGFILPGVPSGAGRLTANMASGLERYCSCPSRPAVHLPASSGQY